MCVVRRRAVWFGFEAPLLLKGALLVCVGSVVWLNRQSVAPANAGGGSGSITRTPLSDLVLLLVCCHPVVSPGASGLLWQWLPA